jgi:hypothetical protein
MPYENHRKHGHCKNTKCNRDNEDENARHPRSGLGRSIEVAPSPVWTCARNHSKSHDQANGDNTQVDSFCDFAEFPLCPIVLDNKQEIDTEKEAVVHGCDADLEGQAAKPHVALFPIDPCKASSFGLNAVPMM